ncbi:carboxymuconolactone decarboxylase family protein [Neisseria sp. Ec49-e6-T10]|uniref:carboxymuconolactone decarboxylase family protein n=1 Tax=Neisseria sp. Ec49-e6-T10 TaxID=3140744 RepID=UPI003EC0C864
MQTFISEQDFFTHATDAKKALLDLGAAVKQSGLDDSLCELVKIRVSQINGCSYCLSMHLNVAHKLNIAPSKLDLLQVWRDTDLFDAKEQAALNWAEHLTQMAQVDITAADYEQLNTLFSATEIMFLTSCIANINAWNRIAGGLKFKPHVPSAG